MTGLEDGSWASFHEVKIYDAAGMAKLTPNELKTFQVSAPELQNVAVKKKASASSTEEGHDALLANDGDDDTRWCAVDGSLGEWWMVDLADPPATAPAAGTAPATAPAGVEVREVDIRWEQRKSYQFVVEGSLDGEKWDLLSDQKANTQQLQVQQLRFAPKVERYVRMHGHRPGRGAWASISEAKVLGARK